MGVSLSLCGNKSEKTMSEIQLTEAELLAIKDHPDRNRRRSSVAPSQPTIKEEQILEDFCRSTEIEPDLPADGMDKNEAHKLVNKLSTLVIGDKKSEDHLIDFASVSQSHYILRKRSKET